MLLPLAATFVETSKIGWHEFWHIVTAPRALAAYGLSFGASLIGAAINFVLGTLVAWVLVRYQFPFKRLLDSLVDLPFALPTAVAGHRAHDDLRAERAGSGARSPSSAFTSPLPGSASSSR